MDSKMEAIMDLVRAAINPKGLDDAIDFVTELRDELDMTLDALNIDKANEER